MTREQAFEQWFDSARHALERLANCHPAERLRNARSLRQCADRLIDVGMSHYAVNHPAPPESREPTEVKP